MNSRLSLAVWFIASLVAILMAVVQILGGLNLISAAKLGMFLAPFGLALFLGVRPLWPGLVLGSLTVSLVIPLPVLSRFSPAILMGIALAVVTMGQRAMAKERVMKHSAGYYMMMLSAAIVFCRIIVDRPGSATLGGTGGGGEALYYGMGFLAFWAVSIVASKPWNIKLNMQTALAVALAAQAVLLVRTGLGSSRSVFHVLYSKQAWLLVPFALAYLQDRKIRAVAVKGGARIFEYVVYFFAIGAAALTGHRSRPLYAVAQMICVSSMYKHFKRTIPIYILMGVLGFSVVLIKPDILPANVVRAVSTVLKVNAHDFLSVAQEHSLSTEVGWDSEFRRVMFSIALTKIQKNPVFGEGFAFDLDSIIQQFYLSNYYMRGLGALAMAGGYHSSVLSLAVFTGIPATCLFLLGFSYISIKFYRQIKAMPHGLEKLMGTVLIGFLVPVVLQMLVNGTGDEFYVSMVILGFMYGFMRRADVILLIKEGRGNGK